MSLSWPILLLLTLAFSLSAWLEPRFQAWAGSRAKSSDVLSVALGDSRRLFARHFYVKADAYFHSGYYPTIYDTHPPARETHMAGASQEPVGQGAGSHSDEHEEEESRDFLGKPKDWIDAFSRHF